MKVFCQMEEQCECLVSNGGEIYICTVGAVSFHITPTGMRAEN